MVDSVEPAVLGERADRFIGDSAKKKLLWS